MDGLTTRQLQGLANECHNATYQAHMVTTDAMSSAASHLSREWGDSGYRIGLVRSHLGGGIFGCRASDGSEFFFHVDRYSNVTDLPESER